MMSGIIARSWKTVKPHVPLIKFRKGGSTRGSTIPDQSAQAVSASAQKVPPPTARPVIEDWQLPPRYRRSELDEKEIDMINSGGAY